MAASLPIQALHHISLVARDTEASVAFYRDVLGFREIERPAFNFRGAWLYNYGFQIHIIENADAAGGRSEKIDSRADHIAFAVEDDGPVAEILQQHNIPCRTQVNAGGVRQTFFQDPDGHHIEIAVYPPRLSLRAGHVGKSLQAEQ
ncbi:MAG: VOC family protein [Planctomycetes bacterium]|nr:VOC family protein [Planctomycetota bacterium]